MMTDVRAAILKEVKRQGLTPASLSKLVDGKVFRQTIYNFINKGRPLQTDALGHIMDALGLEIRRKR